MAPQRVKEFCSVSIRPVALPRASALVSREPAPSNLPASLSGPLAFGETDEMAEGPERLAEWTRRANQLRCSCHRRAISEVGHPGILPDDQDFFAHANKPTPSTIDRTPAGAFIRRDLANQPASHLFDAKESDP